MMRVALRIGLALTLVLGLASCRGDPTTDIIAPAAASAFTVDVIGEQVNQWTMHYYTDNPKDTCYNGPITEDGQGSQTAQFESVGAPPLVVLRDDGSTDAVTGDYLLPLHVDLSRQGSVTFGGTGGCIIVPPCTDSNGNPQPCPPGTPDCGPKTLDLQVRLHYNGSDGSVAINALPQDPSSRAPIGWEQAFNACPYFGAWTLLGAAGATLSTAPPVEGHLTVDSLIDSNDDTLTTTVDATVQPAADFYGVTTTDRLTLTINLNRRYKFAAGPKYQFADCAAAQKALTGMEIATNAFGITLAPGNTQVTKQSDGSYQATVSAQVKRFSSDTITLPDWTNAKGPDAAAWQKMRDALTAHELGHSAITDTFLQEHAAAETFVGKGDTPEHAIADAQMQHDVREKALSKELSDRQNAYDAQTKHGAKQSNVGGVDVLIECPGDVPLKSS